MLKKFLNVHKRYKVIITLMLMAVFTAFMPVKSFAAGSWTGTYTTKINGFSAGAVNESDDVTEALAKPWNDPDVKASDNNWANRLLGKIFASGGVGIEWAFNAMNIAIDSVILGNQASKPPVIGDGGINNPFHFTLENNNIYGYTSAVAYSAMRQIICVFMAIVFMLELAKCGLSTNGQDKARLKDYTVHFVFIFMLLYLMPNIVDLFIYVKSVALQKIGSSLSTEAGNFAITTNMWNIFTDDPSLITGVLYLASVGLMVYMMALYVGNALTCTVLFAFFPLVGILSVKDRGLLGAWLKQMLGTLFVPLFDGVLLFIPAMFFKYATADITVGAEIAVYLIGLVMCFFIIPSRKVILGALGLGSVGAGENAGIAAAVGAGSLIGETAKKLRNHSKTKRSAKEEREKAMEEVDKEEALADSEEKADDMNRQVAAGGRGTLITTTALDEQFAKGKDQNSEGENDSKEDDSGDNTDSAEGAKKELGNAGGASNSAENGGDENEPPQDNKGSGRQEINGEAIVPNAYAERRDNLNELDKSTQDITEAENTLREANTASANAQERIEALAAQNNEIDRKGAERVASGEAKNNPTYDQRTGLTDAEKLNKAENNLEISKLKEERTRNNNIANDAQQQLANAKERQRMAQDNERAFARTDKALGGSGKSYTSAQELDTQRSYSKAMASLATHKTFDSPLFADHLSGKEKADFRRQRAAEMRKSIDKQYKRTLRESRSETVGGIVGGSVGAAAMLMTGQAVQGAEIGAAIGGEAPVAVSDIAYNVGDDSRNDAPRHIARGLGGVAKFTSAVQKVAGPAQKVAGPAQKVTQVVQRGQSKIIESGEQRRLKHAGYDKAKNVNISYISSNIKPPAYTSNIVMSNAGIQNLLSETAGDLINDQVFLNFANADGRMEKIKETAVKNQALATQQLEQLIREFKDSKGP